MTFDELRIHIEQSAGDRVPQALTEMSACEHFAQYLNKTRGMRYVGVSKDFTLEDDGVDALIYEPDNYETNIYVQVTRSREYNMSPDDSDHTVDLSGSAIIDALQYKCSIYQQRGIYTQAMVLVIVGVTPVRVVRELMEHEHFHKPFEETTCFNGIYYVTGEKVVELKALKMPGIRSLN